jgi:hypothetical protein
MKPSVWQLGTLIAVAAASIAIWVIVAGDESSVRSASLSLWVSEDLVSQEPSPARFAMHEGFRFHPPLPGPPDTTAEVRVDVSTFTYAAPEAGMTVAEFVADMRSLTGLQVEVSECSQRDTHPIRFVEPVTIPKTDIRDFFEMVLAVHLKDISEEGGHLLVEGMAETGRLRRRRRYAFLHPDALEHLGEDATTVVSTAIPILPLTPWEAHDVLLAVEWNHNREGCSIETVRSGCSGSGARRRRSGSRRSLTRRELGKTAERP